MEPPKWTVLPPLELRNAGTPWTESLNGYANRLAKIGGISWRKLLELIDTHSSEEPSGYIEQRRLDGLGPVSVRRTRSLEKLTGQSLAGATLYGLSDIVSSRAASWSRHAAWCPICIGASDKDESATERLIWSFDAYSHCSLHDVRIENSCSNCGLGKLKSIASRQCPFCGDRLDRRARFDSANPSQRWINQCIEELISWCSTHPNQRLELSSLGLFIEAVTARSEKRKLGYRPPVRSPVSYFDFKSWTRVNGFRLFRRNDPSRVEFNELLNLSAMQCVSVLDILLQPLESASDLLPGIGSNPELPLGRGRVADERREFARLIDALLSDDQCVLPSFQVLSQLSGRGGSFKSGLPHHHAHYAVRLRRQRVLICGVSRRTINRAFRLACQLQSSLQGRLLICEAVAKRIHIEIGVASNIVRSAELACSFLLPARKASSPAGS